MSHATTRWRGPPAPRRRKARRALLAGALAWAFAATVASAQQPPACAGDCAGVGRISAADLVLMTLIAGESRDLAECPAGDVGGDGHITADEIDQAVHDIFACGEPTRYDALAAEFYEIAYPADVVTLQQAAGIVSALEHAGELSESELDALLGPLLSELGIDTGRIAQTHIYTAREAGDCEDCLATCTGRCVQGPRGDCFCYERLPTDPPARVNVAILFLEHAGDEIPALDVLRRPCTDVLLPGGVHDSFGAGNGTELSTQSPGLQALIQTTGNPPLNFDTTTIDRIFGQSFTLPTGKCLASAKVLLRARPLSGNPSPGARNDLVRFGFVSPAGQFVGPSWAAYFGTLPANTGLPILLGQQWTPNNFPAGVSWVFTLSSLTGGTNLLPALQANGFLDVYMQDDSSMDYVDLLVRLCDCPPPTPTVTPTRTRTPTPTVTATPSATVAPTIGPCLLTMTACKQTLPAGGTGFGFHSGVLFQGVVLDDGQCATRQSTCGSIWDVYEVIQPGVTLANINCVVTAGNAVIQFVGATLNPTTGFEPGDNQVVYYTFTGGTAIQCTFVNIIPTPTVTPTRPTSTVTATATRTPVPTSSATGTVTATRSATPTGSATATATPTLRPTDTPSRTATVTATPTATPVGTPTCVAPPQDLVAWWPLDEPSGAPAVADIGLPPANTGAPQPGPIGPSGAGPTSVAGNLVITPADGAFYHFTPSTYVAVPHSGDFDLANADLTIDAWVKPLPGPWVAGRDSLHVYTVVDKLDLATNSGYAFYLQVRTTCPTCPPAGQQPPPSGSAATTAWRLAFAVGTGAGLTVYTSAPFYSGTGILFPSPTPATPLTPQPPGWTHVTVSVDRTQNLGRFYVNGAHLGGSDFTAAAGVNNTAPVWLGGTRLYGTAHAPAFVEFTLNEIEVFDAVLSPATIQPIAAANGGKCKYTPTPTRTPTGTTTRTVTATPSSTPTRPGSPTATATRTATVTRSATASATASRTRTATPTATPPCVTPPADMIAWWTADLTTADLSGNGYTGAFFQPPGAYTAGKVGAAFSLPTIPDFVQASPSLNFSGNFSLDAWIRTTNSAQAPIIDKRLNAGSNPVGYYLYVFGGTLAFELGDGQPALAHVSPGPVISDGNWHHVAVTVDRGSTTGGRLYVDGALVHTFDPTTRPGSIANGFSLRIGQQWVSAIGFQGAIDEVELFDRALQAQEVQAIVQADASGKCKTPLPTRTRTATATRTATSTRTATHTPVPTATRTPTGTQTATRTATTTRTATATRTVTHTLPPSPTATITPTAPPTPTATITRTPSATRTITLTPTVTQTRTVTATFTPSRTATVTATRTPTTQCFAELCVIKFNDLDGDGVQDPGEFGLAGWTIFVVDPSMNVVPVVTGAQGVTCIGMPAPVAYTANEALQPGWTQTFPPPPGQHSFFLECNQLLNIFFGNRETVPVTPTRTATATPTRTRTPNILPND